MLANRCTLLPVRRCEALTLGYMPNWKPNDTDRSGMKKRCGSRNCCGWTL